MFGSLGVWDLNVAAGLDCCRSSEHRHDLVLNFFTPVREGNWVAVSVAERKMGNWTHMYIYIYILKIEYGTDTLKIMDTAPASKSIRVALICKLYQTSKRN